MNVTDGNLYAAPANSDTRWLVVYRRGALWAVFAAIWLAAMPTHSTAVGALGKLGFMAAFLFWCSLDAAFHEKELPHGLALPMVAVLPVSLAIYLCWTRGWAGLFSLCKATGLLIAAGGAAHATAWLLSFL
jgi:hypothetical protein